MTFRLRLTLLFVASLAILGALIAGVTYLSVQQRLAQQDRNAATQLARTAALAADEEIALDRLAGAGDRIWIVNGRGQVVGHSFHAAGKTLAAVHTAVAGATAAGMTTATAPTASGGAAIVVHSDAQTRSALAALRRTLVFALLAGIVLAAVAGMVLASRALRPVDRMREEVDEIPGQDLDRRLHVGRNDELGRLARAFNRLLARVEAASRVQEQFIADASHELKTPITAIEGHARIVLRAIDRGDRTLARESADVVARQSHRIALTLRELLELAQAGEAPPPTEPVRLDVVVRDATDEAQALAPDRAIRASVVPATVLGDPDRLRELVSVLVDNALKYSPPERPVEIGVSTSNGRGPVLTVRDHGPGLSEAELSAVFARFARGTAATGVPGSGLGLPIARAIADRHGATISLSAAAGGGAIAEVRFPAAGATRA